MSDTCISVSLWILDRNSFVDKPFMIISNQYVSVCHSWEIWDYANCSRPVVYTCQVYFPCPKHSYNLVMDNGYQFLHL